MGSVFLGVLYLLYSHGVQLEKTFNFQYIWLGMGIIVVLGRLWNIKPANIMTITSILIASLGIYLQAHNYNEQFQQFASLHRARLVVGINGDVRNFELSLFNKGDLPAKNVLLAWKMIRVNSEGNFEDLSPFDPQNNLLEWESLDVENKITVSLKAKVDLNAEVIMLLIRGTYEGAGIREKREIESRLLWDVKVQPHRWVVPTPLDPQHILAAQKGMEKLSEEFYANQAKGNKG